MTSAPPFASRSRTALDDRIESATGRTVDELWKHRDRGLLDEDQARLVDTHRALVQGETAVSFHRNLLQRLASGEFPVDQALFDLIDRTVGQLRDAAAQRDKRQATTETALEPVEAAARSDRTVLVADLPAKDLAALLAITAGAKLHEHLLTGRLSVVTSSRTHVTYERFQRLEQAGLVIRDTSHPPHAGQPVTLTDAGRTALSARRTSGPVAAPSPSRAGAWPLLSTPSRR